jgi:hypothetical protein
MVLMRPSPGRQMVKSSGDSTGVSAGRSDVVVMPGRGLRLPGHLPFERWLVIGRQLAGINSSTAWCLGDWLVYGERAYASRYREAIERTSLDYQTLRNYAWVANRFPLSRRQDSVSFGHHAEVAALPAAEQDYWLRKAQELGWSVKKLRRQVRASYRERTENERGQADELSGGSQSGQPARNERFSVSLAIRVRPGQLEAYQSAADQAGFTLPEWAVLTLDQAARNDKGFQGTGPKAISSSLTSWAQVTGHPTACFDGCGLVLVVAPSPD